MTFAVWHLVVGIEDAMQGMRANTRFRIHPTLNPKPELSNTRPFQRTN